MRIKEAAKELGISISLLRRLEREGRLPPAMRDLGGQRRYAPEDIAKLRGLLFRRRMPSEMSQLIQT